MNDVLSRVESIKDGTTTLQSATYLGGGSVVKLNSPQPNLVLDYTGGTDYGNSLDQFGRVIDHKWTNASGTLTKDEFAYGYDRDSNRIYKSQVNTTTRDEFYAYDTLNRLVSLDRGTLNSGHTAISGTATKQEAWSFDPLGNWNGYTTKTSGTTDLDQTRSHNKANEITGITNTVGTAWVTPVQDNAGNLTTMPQVVTPSSSLTATYDAWNRLKTATLAGGSSYTYFYDGLGRRVNESVGTAPSFTSTTDYYSGGWRTLVEDSSVSTAGRTQYTWGLRYIDELVCKDQTTSSTARHYACQDANFDVTALVGSTGVVAERYSYTAYGKRTVMTASFAPLGFSPRGMNIGHQGLRHDDSGLVYNRARYLHVGIGRFIHRDPLGYVGGENLFEYCASRPIDDTDSTGQYDRGGHFWATYITAVSAGMSPQDAYEIAYYTQLPDQYGPWDAKNAAVAQLHMSTSNPNYSWYRDIEQVLHSLHGGNPAAAQTRRACLSKLVADTSLPLWQRGMINHALGDAYAHTYPNGNAYSSPLGHALHGHWPDMISNRPGLFYLYTTNLFGALDGNTNPLANYLQLFRLQTSFPMPAGFLNALNDPMDIGWDSTLADDEARYLSFLAIRHFGYNHSYVPKAGNLDKAMWMPTNTDVADLMKLIKCKCGIK